MIYTFSKTTHVTSPARRRQSGASQSLGLWRFPPLPLDVAGDREIFRIVFGILRPGRRWGIVASSSLLPSASAGSRPATNAAPATAMSATMPNAPPPPPPSSSASAGSAVARLTGMPPNAADASSLAPFATEGFRAGSASRFVAARAATRAGRTATCRRRGACRWSAARARRSFRACGASGRDARRSHWTSSGGCTVRRLVRCGGVGETGADALPRAGRRVGRRARSTHSSPWSWCVRFTRRSSSYGAAADEPGELGVRAPTSNSKRAFFTRAFQRQSHVSNRANRQDFARLPLAEEIARIYCQRQTPTTRSHRASHRRD